MAKKLPNYHRLKMKVAQDERARNRKRLIKIKKHMKPINKILEQIKIEKVVNKKI